MTVYVKLKQRRLFCVYADCVNLIYLFIADTKSIVWTHTLCRTQVDKNRQYRM